MKQLSIKLQVGVLSVVLMVGIIAVTFLAINAFNHQHLDEDESGLVALPPLGSLEALANLAEVDSLWKHHKAELLSSSKKVSLSASVLNELNTKTNLIAKDVESGVSVLVAASKKTTEGLIEGIRIQVIELLRSTQSGSLDMKTAAQQVSSISAIIVKGAEEQDVKTVLAQETLDALGEIGEIAREEVAQLAEFIIQSEIKVNHGVEVARENVLERTREQGRGFAVVADEVRALAARTSTSADDITGLIHGFSSKVGESVGTMSALVDQVNVTQKQSQTATEAFQGMNHEVGHSVEANKHILSYNAEQTQTLEDLSSELSELFMALKANTAKADSTSLVAEKRKQAAEDLKQNIGNFVVSLEGIALQLSTQVCVKIMQKG